MMLLPSSDSAAKNKELELENSSETSISSEEATLLPHNSELDLT
jgi:hypothetical protein